MLGQMLESVAERTLFEYEKLAIWGRCNSKFATNIQFADGN